MNSSVQNSAVLSGINLFRLGGVGGAIQRRLSPIRWTAGADIEAVDLLVGLGEVAATVAGFSGIVAVLGTRSVDSLAPVARFRLFNLLVVSLSAVFFAFLPAVLEQFTENSAVVWPVSGACVSLFWVAFLIQRLRMLHLLSGDGGMRRWMAGLFFIVAVLTVCGLAADAFGVLGSPVGAAYCAAILSLVVLAGLQFVLLVVETRQPPAV